MKSLQRALEREVEKEQEEGVSMITQAINVTSDEGTGHAAGLSRSGTNESSRSRRSERTKASSEDSTKARSSKDTLDREFLETGIDALRRMSKGTVLTLPSWTITKYEVDRDEKIGVGFFSDVYKGTWRDRTVAIKVLAPTTPRNLFVHEVEIWKNLSHSNVLALLGASSTSGEAPWFFVSPYMKNGSLVTYLKGLPSLDQANPLRMIYEVAKGMEYLHGKGVLHGDLKVRYHLLDSSLHILDRVSGCKCSG
jgi:abelson tyrosine-protein kinase 1